MLHCRKVDSDRQKYEFDLHRKLVCSVFSLCVRGHGAVCVCVCYEKTLLERDKGMSLAHRSMLHQETDASLAAMSV